SKQEKKITRSTFSMLALQDKKGIKKARAIQFCHDQSLPVFHDIYFFSDSVLLFGKRTASAKV
ncbi:MAG: hypothetical protein II017_00130, partial [Erysipelotrichaceae bacterium]|nr:hypothetical protein [Erysipelotrichaceae bacterium]